MPDTPPASPGPDAPVVPPGASFDDAAVQAVGETVRHAAGVLAGLQDLLQRLDSSINDAAAQRRTEIEIGQLITRTNEFVERSVAEAEEQARHLVAEAEFEATRIVAAAKEQAHRLIEEAKQSSALPPEAVRQLQVTIDGFGHLNGELLRELTALGQTLATYARPPAPTVPAAAPPPPAQPASLETGSAPTSDAQTPPVPEPERIPDGYWSLYRPAGSFWPDGDPVDAGSALPKPTT